MAYHFESFGGLTLPVYNVQTDQSGGSAESTLVRTINGSFDTAASKREVPVRGVFTMRGIIADESIADIVPEYWLTGDGDRLVVGGGDVFVFTAGATGTVKDIRLQLDALRAWIGKVGTLVRVPNTGTDGNQSVNARLLSVRHSTNVNQHRAYCEVDLQFESATPYWHGQSKTASRSGTTISATNAGNAPARDAVLTVTGPIASSVVVSGPGISFTWSGTLGAGLSLVIQGNQVLANNAPSRVTLGSHTRDVLVELEPGASVLTVTGGASARLDWYDSWQ